MSKTKFWVSAALIAGVMLWQILAGSAFGTWRRPAIIRENNPLRYWRLIAIQGAILVAWLMTGKSWQAR
jgi:hypothetical protein